MKVIAFYLPQFHTFPENDAWWGKGFTEWTSVKGAKPLYEGHMQPRVPLNENYYDLTDIEVMRWQANLAKEYGVYGFCYYHYWFDGKLLMEKPMEMMKDDNSIDLPFCICWANENWTRAWAAKQREVLISQTYGERVGWKEHFDYLLPFFKDKRYICVDGKPLFVIYRPEIIPCLRDMLEYWQALAVQAGLPGLAFAYQYREYNHLTSPTGDLFDYGIEYQPIFSRKKYRRSLKYVWEYGVNTLANRFSILQNRYTALRYDYCKEWENIIHTMPRDEKMIPGAFVDWDNTPRHKFRGSMYENATPENFEKYLTIQIRRAKEIYQKDMLFMFAWNEWGEGGYLEPDEQRGYGMLQAIKNALEANGEISKGL